MSQALKELFYEVCADDFKKQKEVGIKIGQSQTNQLGSILIQENRLDDLARSFRDPVFQNQLLQEYNLLETANQ